MLTTNNFEENVNTWLINLSFYLRDIDLNHWILLFFKLFLVFSWLFSIYEIQGLIFKFQIAERFIKRIINIELFLSRRHFKLWCWRFMATYFLIVLILIEQIERYGLFIFDLDSKSVLPSKELGIMIFFNLSNHATLSWWHTKVRFLNIKKECTHFSRNLASL